MLSPVNREIVRNVLDHLPTGVGMWSLEPLSCIFNQGARQLTGFSDRDFEENAALWLSRVHSQDQYLISDAWEKLQRDGKRVTCDYRFFPYGRTEEIWIRDVSDPFQNPYGKVTGIISVYTDVSDLRAEKKQDTHTAIDLKKAVERLAHDVRNYAHVICGTLEILQMTGSMSSQPAGIREAVEHIARFIGELEEYCVPPRTQLSIENPALLLQEVIARMQDELQDRGIQLKMVHQALPNVRIDAKQISRAIQRVLDFSAALLPDGGTLNIRARQREMNGKQYVELRIISDSRYLTELDGQNVFEPFLQVQKYKVGLSLALARESLYRNRGEISFQKSNSQRALFNLLLEVSN